MAAAAFIAVDAAAAAAVHYYVHPNGYYLVNCGYAAPHSMFCGDGLRRDRRAAAAAEEDAGEVKVSLALRQVRDGKSKCGYFFLRF